MTYMNIGSATTNHVRSNGMVNTPTIAKPQQQQAQVQQITQVVHSPSSDGGKGRIIDVHA
ncbi:hypothetical protein NP603_17780 [Methylomonas sp. SURF-1]|uniref:Uncharacterized protein n=2 Tax=Methylomonas TaxID=416 RepID=A0ABU4UKF2_9GAMM|nr:MULTISPECIES: hypothetical protein [Methylomonas]MCQ8182976.1 hypothetical protein [Methylomonas sp. SURF-1]MDX8129641.1 hypothetical protein [Methylomonas sp. OY6]BBL60941.1 hypothetical protein MKFW12EY_45540 [Methylomonas koyamae]